MSRWRRILWKLAVTATGRGDRAAYTRRLREWQWLDPGDARRLQQARLKSLLVAAYMNVPYYRGLLSDAGVVREDGEVDVENFTRLPLLRRNDLRESYAELQSQAPASARRYANTSGGSTGEPVRFVQDEDYRNWAGAARALTEEWSGYAVGMKRALLWGSERDLFVGKETPRTRLNRFVKNELWLNAFRMNSEQMRDHVRRLNAFGADSVLAYAESIYELARFAESESLYVRPTRAVTSAAGTLHPHMRETISRVFSARVFNSYGSREASSIAFECDRGEGLHVIAPHVLVELLHPSGSPIGPGEVGEVVVTVLTNHTMPLIRYRIGDVASWAEKPCSCGRGWPLLRSVSGRVTDVFVRRDGGVVVPEYLIHLVGVVLNTGWIRKYQLVQKAVDLVEVVIAPHDPAMDPEMRYAAELREIEAKIKLVMGEQCSVAFEFVEEIRPSESGKYRYTVSRVAR